MADGVSTSVRVTGGQIDDMLMAVIDSAFDKDSTVKDSMSSSLHKVGKKQPNLVLSSCHSYLLKHAKLSHGHRVVILTGMEGVIRDALDKVEKQLAVDIIKQVSMEMTQAKDVVPEWQTAASKVLVALGTQFCTEVMDDLLQKFQPGVLPHFFVVQTMANLAAENVFGMVPFIKVILGSMLPMMGMCKHDNMRWVFSSALSKFCEAILDYVANIEKAPDQSVTKEAFSSEVDSAYDVLFNVWMQSKEIKLRSTIVEALGHMSHVMSEEKMHLELPKLVPGILALYKRHQEAYHITVGVCMILEASTEGGSVILDPYLDQLLSVLFPQVCQPMDYNNALAIKNHNEILRCFAVVNGNFSDRIINSLLEKINQQNEKIKMGALTILRHLVNTGGSHMDEKRNLVISGLKGVLNETNNKVKKILAQVIIAMAHHGYLEMEGGQLMLEFIVRQCALPSEHQAKRPVDPEYVSNDALRYMCENVLQLLANTVENMDVVLWPALLEYLVPEQYTGAVGYVCKSLCVIAERKRNSQDDDYEIDYDKLVNIPRPVAVISRTMALIGHPSHGHQRGLHVLNTMKAISPLLHENLVDLWDTIIPRLIKFIEDKEEEDGEWSQKNWEDLVLKLLSKSLDHVNDEDWFVELGNEMANQLALYDKYPDEKNTLFKCLGIVLRRSGKTELVSAKLDNIFSSVKHTSQVERDGCAIACGFTAASHIDTVLTKLDSISKPDHAKKSSGLFGFIKDSVGMKGEVDDMVKATLMLCYGYVTLYAPRDIITSRLEGTFMRNIVNQFGSVKDAAVKQNLIRSCELIGQAMHEDHLQKKHIFTKRDDLLLHMQNYLRTENSSDLLSDTRVVTLQACATLVKLDPCLPGPECHNLLKTSLLCVMSLSLDCSQSKKGGKEESYQEVEHLEHVLTETVTALQSLLREILLKDCSPEGLLNLVEHLSPWLAASQDAERQRCLSLLLSLFTLYLDHITPGVGDSSNFSTMGSIMGRLVCRCTDPDLVVRKLAVDCLYVLLKIALKYEGKDSNSKDQMVDAVPSLKERLTKTDSNILFSCAKDLAKVLSKKTPSDQLFSLVSTLTAALADPHPQSSSGVCVVLNGVLKPRGGELASQFMTSHSMDHLHQDNVNKLFASMHEKLAEISNPQTRTGTLRSIRTLASHHFLAVLSLMLAQPLPFTQDTCDCWAVFAQDKDLASQMLESILDTLSRSKPYEEKTEGSFMGKDKVTTTATVMPIACVCAMREIFRAEEAEAVMLALYPRLFTALLINTASVVGAKPPRITKEEKDKKTGKVTGKKITQELELKPSAVATEALRQLLESSKQKEYIDSLETYGVWSMVRDEDKYAEGFTLVARGLEKSTVETQPNYVTKVITFLNPVMSSPYEPQKVMAAAFFAELISLQCGDDISQVEMLVNILLARLVDVSLPVRMYCIRGLGNIADTGAEQVQKFSTTVLSAMMAGMDDKDDLNDEITLEAMNGLSKILAVIDEAHIRGILINVALRIRPCFEKDQSTVRKAAFKLFGNLARFGDGASKEPFLEQIHSNLVSVLLHLNDPEQDVRRVCKTTLKQLGPLLGSTPLNEMFQKHLIDTAGLHYGEFMNDLSKIMIEDFSQKHNFYVMGCVNFFKSNWSEVRCNAAMFTGFLLGNAPVEMYGKVSKEHVCGALILLLKDQSSDVRISAAEAISLLHNF